MTMAPDLQQSVDLELAQEQVRRIVAERQDMDGAGVRAALNRITGGEASGVKATNGADTFLTVYHRYYGKEHPMPSYQVPKTLTARIPDDHEAFPPGVAGQIAWSLDPAEAGVLKERYGPVDMHLGLACYFSPTQDDPQIVADVKGAGIPFFCNKGKRSKDGTIQHVRFSDAMALEGHLKKHARAMPAFTRYRDIKRQKERDEAANTTNAAILELATRLAGGETIAEEFPCDVCGKSNKSAAGLAAHKRSHAEES